jgi:type I restriction enzyme M protein
MSDDQKKQLEQQLWNIANTLRGKMNADEFRNYLLDSKRNSKNYHF